MGIVKRAGNSIPVFAALAMAVTAAAGAGTDSTRSAPPAQPAQDIQSGGDTVEAAPKTVKGASSQNHREKEVSRVRLDRETLKEIPAAQGDPMRALGTLPGTTTQNDMSVRPFVRGGKSEETQVLWEGIPLLQPYHFGSLYSQVKGRKIEIPSWACTLLVKLRLSLSHVSGFCAFGTPLVSYPVTTFGFSSRSKKM